MFKENIYEQKAQTAKKKKKTRLFLACWLVSLEEIGPGKCSPGLKVPKGK